MIGCDKWKTGCFGCPQYREYPKSLFDNSKYMFMAAVGDDIRGMVDFCKEHYIYDNLFIGVVITKVFITTTT